MFHYIYIVSCDNNNMMSTLATSGITNLLIKYKMQILMQQHTQVCKELIFHKIYGVYQLF